MAGTQRIVAAIFPRGAEIPGRHKAPRQSDPFIGLVVLALLALLAVVIILALA
jgi:hypothetical protein